MTSPSWYQVLYQFLTIAGALAVVDSVLIGRRTGPGRAGQYGALAGVGAGGVITGVGALADTSRGSA